MKRIISILIIFNSFIFFTSCSYSKEISIIRTANYDHFLNGYTLQIIPVSNLKYAYAGYRVSK